MMLTRCHPNGRVARQRHADALDRVFHDFWGARPDRFRNDVSGRTATQDGLVTGLAADVRETDDDYRLSIEIPGLDKDDFKITLEDNTLTVSAEKKRESTGDDDRYHRRERSFGRIERRFAFGDDINLEKIEASYRNGVLEITVAKAEAAKPRSVEVKVD